MEQAIAEIRQPGLDQTDRGWQDATEKISRAGWAISRIADNSRILGDTDLLIGGDEVLGHIPQKCCVEIGRFIEGERWDQPGFGASGRRGLGHKGDAARVIATALAPINATRN